MPVNLPTYFTLLSVMRLDKVEHHGEDNSNRYIKRKCCHVMKLCIDVDEA